MAAVQETIEVTGIRCERCVMRLAKMLEGHDGLEAASATLMGQVTLVYDDAHTSRDALLAAMSRGGFGAVSASPSFPVGGADGHAGQARVS